VDFSAKKQNFGGSHLLCVFGGVFDSARVQERDILINRLTLVVPVFNESESWQKEYWIAAVSKSNIDWIFVNDGSSDNSQELIEEICLYENATLVNHDLNLGKAEAIRTGFNLYFNRSFGSTEQLFIGYLDSDRAFNLDEIERFKGIVDGSLRHFQSGFESLWSARVNLKGRLIARKKYRHYIGRSIVTLLSFAYPAMPYDPQSGFKIFICNESLVEIFNYKFKTKWFVDLEIYCRYAKISGSKLQIWEEPLYFWRDVGDSSLTLKSIPCVIAEIFYIFRQLLGIRN